MAWKRRTRTAFTAEHGTMCQFRLNIQQKVQGISIQNPIIIIVSPTSIPMPMPNAPHPNKQPTHPSPQTPSPSPQTP